MSDITSNTIAIETAIERLRQERETFDQRKQQENRWFSLRLRMGYVAVVLLPAVAAVSAYIVINPSAYSATAVTTAIGTLFVDVLGLFAAVWKVVLKPESITKLAPVTSGSKLPKLPEVQ